MNQNSMPFESSEVMKIFGQNKHKLTKKLDEAKASVAINDYFLQQNKVLRLKLYKEQICKSAVAASQPLEVSYVNVKPHDRKLLGFHIKEEKDEDDEYADDDFGAKARVENLYNPKPREKAKKTVVQKAIEEFLKVIADEEQKEKDRLTRI